MVLSQFMLSERGRDIAMQQSNVAHLSAVSWFADNFSTVVQARDAPDIDAILLSRDNIHIANQRGQCLRTLDSADNHRFAASADRDFLLGQTIGWKTGRYAHLF